MYVYMYMVKRMIKNRKCHNSNPNNSQQFSHTHASLHHIECSFHIAPCFLEMQFSLEFATISVSEKAKAT